MRFFALLVSAIFGLPWIIAIVWLMVFHTGLTYSQEKLFIIVLPLLLIVLPVLYFLHEVFDGDISDIDITKRKERIGIMTFACILECTSLGIVYFYGNHALLAVSLAVMATFFGVFIITMLWKISLHMTLNVIGIVLLHVLGTVHYTYLMWIIPLVFWSRLYLRRHTAAQLVAGTALSFTIMNTCLGVAGFELW